MRIHGLRIDGFGQFANRELGPFGRPVTVFYGPNEAGKTTLLEFIRRVLFGFPDRRSRRNPYSPLAGGRPRGSVTIISDAGEIVTVQRVQGSGDGPVTLTTGAGETVPAAELPRLLGSHSRSVFENVFAFTLDELHDDALLTDDSVNSQIYSAGMGATNLPGAMKTLNDDKGSLFLKGGSRHAIYDAAGRLDQVDSGLRDVADNAAGYARQSVRLQQVERELAELRERRLRAESELEERRNLRRAWADWNDLVDAERRLRELPEIAEFPTNGVGRLETLDERAAAAREERETAARRVRSAQDRVALPIEHASILDQSDAVSRLERARSAFDQSVKDVPERQAEIAAKRVELRNTLADLGPDWDAERLTRFDLSLVVREEVSAYGSRLRAARAVLDRSQSALEQRETALAEASQDAYRARSDFDAAPQPALDEDGVRERRRLIRTARNLLDDHARAGDRLRDLQGQLGDEPESESAPPKKAGGIRTLGAALAISGIALAVTGVLVGDWALFISIAAVLPLAAAAYLLVRALSPAQLTGSPVATRIRRQIVEAEERLAQLQTRLVRESAALGVESPDADSLIAAEESLDSEEARLTGWDRLRAASVEARSLVERRTAQRDDSKGAVEAARGALEAAERGWRGWLVDRGLRQTFSPENIEVLRGIVDLGRTRHGEVVGMDKRIEAIHTDITEFIEIAQPLATAHGFLLDPADYPRVAAVADDLIDLRADVARKSRERAEAEDELRAAKEDLAGRESRLRKAEDEIAGLLTAGGARDAEGFRERAGVYAERRQLEAAIGDALNTLQRISGPGDALETLRSRLVASSIQTIADEIRRSEEELAGIDDGIETLATERGTITESLAGLLSEEDSSRLRVDRHRLLEEMRGHARQWTVRTIAENLLKEAQGKFEKERQPAVVRLAEEFFRDITDGRYRTVFSPLGTSEIQVTDSASSPKQPSQLSRGTREQLLLSLRFGLIRDMGQRAERLPVIVDEALVNFDPRRGLRAACGFVELSRANQVLVFTCHPSVVDLFRTAAAESGTQEPDVVRIQLPDSAGQPDVARRPTL